jgi:hypothetical protein
MCRNFGIAIAVTPQLHVWTREGCGVDIVLIIDHDLGFVFWLGQTLDALGYNTLPAKGVPEAIALLKELRVKVDILIVSSSLPGAAEYVADQRQANSKLTVFALIDERGAQAESRLEWDVSQPKPDLPDEQFKQTFLKLVHDVSHRLSLT